MRDPAEKYVPRPDGLNARFYAELSTSGRMRAQSCDSCATMQHPPRYRCAACGGASLSWADSSGIGSVVSWVTTERDVALGWGGELPYTTLLVEFDERFQVIGALRGGDTSRLRVGSRVQAEVEPVSESFARIWFVPSATDR